MEDHGEVEPKNCGGARRWYGVERALAFALPLELFLIPIAFIVSAYIPLVVVVVAALIGWAVPGRPHVGKSVWRSIRETIVWLFAVLHIAIVGLWLYFAVLAYMSFRSAVKDADRVVIRDGGGLCHSDPDKEPVLFEITDKAEIAAFNDMFEFTGRTVPCMCCGYPGVDWWRGDKRVAVSAIHHGSALRVEGPLYKTCRHYRDVIESEAGNLAKAGDDKKPTLDKVREEFAKAGKDFPSCPSGGEYSLSYGEDGTPEVKCTAPRHD